ncbi:MAG: hypothetical protein GY940_45720, partial [bacterium]|nr:hypothetical protein [bacterium]
AIANRLGSTAVINNCTFIDNRASEGKADIDSDNTSGVGDKFQDRFRDGHRGREFPPRRRRF